MYQKAVKQWLSMLLCFVMVVCCLSGVCFSADAADAPFQIHFIDVGQADAMLVICDGETMLVDGGNAADSQIMYSYLEKLNISHLDYVIGTHPHEDHIGGIPGALQYVDSIGTVYCSVTSYTGSAFPKFVTAVQNHGKSIQVPTVGTVFSLGDAVCKIIAVNTPSDDINDSSIVMRITYGENSFLLTGDAELPVEELLLSGNEILKSDVLKVGHHGSSSSTSYLWLRTVDPDYAVICVGADNSYGHPTEAVLSRLRDAEVKTYRTDMQGDILCTSDGKNITFTPSRNANADTFGGIGDNSTVAPSDPKQIVDEAYALAANASLPYTATLTGTITQINTPFSAADNNTITVTMAVAGRESYPIQCYKMSGAGADRLEVGDVITVVGTIKNYVSSSGWSTIEFYYPSLIGCNSDPQITQPAENISSVPVSSVSTGKAYKLIIDKLGTKYYFTGKTDGSRYLASSTNPSEAVTVYLEGATNSYRMYFMNGSTKTYIRLYATSSTPTLKLPTSAPTETYRFDTTLKTLVYTKSSSASYYMGTYGSYTNFSASNTSYVTGSNASNVDVSQFPARLYEVETNENTVSQWNVTLKENICLNFQMNFTNAIVADENAYVSILFCSTETKIPVSEAVNGITLNIAAAQMTEDITICTVSGNGTRYKAGTYSIRKYADYVLSGSYDQTTKNLVKAMLNYGAMAQIYFDYNQQNLANDGITDAASVSLPESTTEHAVSGKAGNLAFYGASFLYRDQLGMRYYFTGTVSGCSFTLNGKTCAPIYKDGMYYIELPGILPQDLTQYVTLTATDTAGNILTVTYGPMNYILRMSQKDNADQQNLLKALYNYHLCAAAYTANT